MQSTELKQLTREYLEQHSATRNNPATTQEDQAFILLTNWLEFSKPLMGISDKIGTDLQVLINVPTEIEFVQMIEKQIDAALVNCGFSRTTTSKGGARTELNYRQFGKCL